MAMRWYVARRVLWAVFATYLALSITFGLLTISPNTGQMQAAFQAAATGGNVTEAQQAYRQRRGLDRPLWQRYVDYVVNMFTFNWGWSFSQNRPVIDAIGSAWPYSAQYMIPATVISVLVAYSIGLYSAMHQYTLTDYVGTFIAFFGISIPNFWFAVMLILFGGVWLQELSLFGADLSWLAFPTYYKTQVEMFSLNNLHQIVLPIVVVSTATVAGQMRYARAQALEYVNAEFVKVAKAKGGSDWHILVWHVLRVAIVPLATILVSEFIALLFAGAFVTEFVFQIPGIGLMAFKAIRDNDTPLIMATTLIPVFLAIIGNLLQDLAYVWLDPRIEYGDR
ncbi:MAG: ABC transporter permease [Halobacteriaceae archaeon]